jgi:hypothetical protein
MPGACLAHRRVQHPARERPDEAGLLGQRDEAIGRDEALLRVLPANQGLDPGHRSGAAIHLRLVVQRQLVVGDRSSQRAHQGEPFAAGLVLIGHVQGVPAAGLLGDVHGDVGLAQQRVGVATVLGEHRDPGAGADGHLVPFEDQRRRERLDDLLGGQHRGPGVGVRQDQRELVAAQAGHRVGGPQRLAQPEGDLLQELVAGQVPERVVDVFEAIQVDDAQRERPPVALRHADGLRQTVLQQHAVGQAGQAVVQGLMRQRLFGPLALGDVVDDRVQQLAALDVHRARVHLDVAHRA